MTKREPGTLSGLAKRLAKKSTDVPASTPADEVEPDAVTEARERAADGRKGILVRARPEAWRSLKLIALDGERTLQDVMTEAINDILKKHDKAPVA